MMNLKTINVENGFTSYELWKEYISNALIRTREKSIEYLCKDILVKMQEKGCLSEIDNIYDEITVVDSDFQNDFLIQFADGSFLTGKMDISLTWKSDENEKGAYKEASFDGVELSEIFYFDADNNDTEIESETLLSEIREIIKF